MESVSRYSAVEATCRQLETLEFINSSIRDNKSGELNSVPLYTFEDFPLLNREESKNQKESSQNSNISTKSKAEKTSKVTFGLIMEKTPGNPSSAQPDKGQDQLENAARVPVRPSWSDVCAPKTVVTPSQAAPAPDQRPASPPKPEDAKTHPILKLLQSKNAVEGGSADKNTRATVLVSELEFHAALSSKEGKISALEQRNATLSENMNILVAQLQQMELVRQHANETVRQLKFELADERNKVQGAAIFLQQLAREGASVHKHENDQEKKALRDEVMKLTQIIEKLQTEHETEVAVLYDERIKTNKDRRDAIRRADQLKVSLISEKNKTAETEICLAKQMEETSKLQAALVKMEKDLEEQRQQWEQEKVRLLTSNQETSEVEKLKYRLESQMVEHEDEVAVLYNELIKRNEDRRDAIRKANQLKENLVEEKNRTKEAEDSLVQQKEEAYNLQVTLVQMEKVLEEQRQQWEQEKSHHLRTNQQERDEGEQLKQQLELQKAEAEQEIAALHLEQENKNQYHQDAARKVMELEMTLVAEKTRTKEAEICLAEQGQETWKIKAALVKMEQDMENQKLLWAQEKSSLLEEQQKTVRNVEAAMKEALEVLHKERKQWETEKSCLLETIATTKESLKEMEVERKTSTESLTEKLKDLQQEMDTLQEKKLKKKSSRKSIFSVFKSSKKDPSQSETTTAKPPETLQPNQTDKNTS
ncbi:golgin subfamily A member 6-like protein 22 [Girardinichthys multiradiatus]|uniref:golgin subfamily A member 6-like protein 22 n=1 Tax=Girardinichthys multiradiatus TaxID=208333 RepID=UPI001FADBD3D|nr:golgin subfamily A member 6-like protein 22 [Girardinichthys multiradiatus]